jgi:hypothetical protein
VSPVVPATGYTNVPDDARYAATRHKHPKAVLPDLLELVMEAFVIFDQAELIFMAWIFL